MDILVKNIQLNNAEKVLKSFETKSQGFKETKHLICPKGSFGDVKITDANIQNNSQFIVDLWDWVYDKINYSE